MTKLLVHPLRLAPVHRRTSAEGDVQMLVAGHQMNTEEVPELMELIAGAGLGVHWEEKLHPRLKGKFVRKGDGSLPDVSGHSQYKKARAAGMDDVHAREFMAGHYAKHGYSSSAIEKFTGIDAQHAHDVSGSMHAIGQAIDAKAAGKNPYLVVAGGAHLPKTEQIKLYQHYGIADHIAGKPKAEPLVNWDDPQMYTYHDAIGVGMDHDMAVAYHAADAANHGFPLADVQATYGLSPVVVEAAQPHALILKSAIYAHQLGQDPAQAVQQDNNVDPGAFAQIAAAWGVPQLAVSSGGEVPGSDAQAWSDGLATMTPVVVSNEPPKVGAPGRAVYLNAVEAGMPHDKAMVLAASTHKANGYPFSEHILHNSYPGVSLGDLADSKETHALTSALWAKKNGKNPVLVVAGGQHVTKKDQVELYKKWGVHDHVMGKPAAPAATAPAATAPAATAVPGGPNEYTKAHPFFKEGLAAGMSPDNAAVYTKALMHSIHHPSESKINVSYNKGADEALNAMVISAALKAKAAGKNPVLVVAGGKHVTKANQLEIYGKYGVAAHLLGEDAGSEAKPADTPVPPIAAQDHVPAIAGFEGDPFSGPAPNESTLKNSTNYHTAVNAGMHPDAARVYAAAMPVAQGWTAPSSNLFGVKPEVLKAAADSNDLLVVAAALKAKQTGANPFLAIAGGAHVKKVDAIPILQKWGVHDHVTGAKPDASPVALGHVAVVTGQFDSANPNAAVQSGLGFVHSPPTIKNMVDTQQQYGLSLGAAQAAVSKMTTLSPATVTAMYDHAVKGADSPNYWSADNPTKPIVSPSGVEYNPWMIHTVLTGMVSNGVAPHYPEASNQFAKVNGFDQASVWQMATYGADHPQPKADVPSSWKPGDPYPKTPSGKDIHPDLVVTYLGGDTSESGMKEAFNNLANSWGHDVATYQALYNHAKKTDAESAWKPGDAYPKNDYGTEITPAKALQFMNSYGQIEPGAAGKSEDQVAAEVSKVLGGDINPAILIAMSNYAKGDLALADHPGDAVKVGVSGGISPGTNKTYHAVALIQGGATPEEAKKVSGAAYSPNLLQSIAADFELVVPAVHGISVGMTGEALQKYVAEKVGHPVSTDQIKNTLISWDVPSSTIEAAVNGTGVSGWDASKIASTKAAAESVGMNTKHSKVFAAALDASENGLSAEAAAKKVEGVSAADVQAALHPDSQLALAKTIVDGQLKGLRGFELQAWVKQNHPSGASSLHIGQAANNWNLDPGPMPESNYEKARSAGMSTEQAKVFAALADHKVGGMSVADASLKWGASSEAVSKHANNGMSQHSYLTVQGINQGLSGVKLLNYVKEHSINPANDSTLKTVADLWGFKTPDHGQPAVAESTGPGESINTKTGKLQVWGLNQADHTYQLGGTAPVTGQTEWHGNGSSGYQPDEHNVLNYYSGSGYDTMNGWLRAYPGYQNKNPKNYVASMDRAMAHSTSGPTARTVKRGVSGQFAKSVKNMKPGDSFIDPGFTSTSRGSGFGGDVKMHITLPPHTRVVNFVNAGHFPNEQEVLVDRHTSYRLDKVVGSNYYFTAMQSAVKPPPSSTGVH